MAPKGTVKPFNVVRLRKQLMVGKLKHLTVKSCANKTHKWIFYGIYSHVILCLCSWCQKESKYVGTISDCLRVTTGTTTITIKQAWLVRDRFCCRVPPPCDITIQETPLFLLPPPPTSLLCHPHTWLFLTFLTLTAWWAVLPNSPAHPPASSVYSLHLWAVLTKSLARISPHFPLTFLPKVCISAGMTGTALPFLPPLPFSPLTIVSWQASVQS